LFFLSVGFAAGLLSAGLSTLVSAGFAAGFTAAGLLSAGLVSAFLLDSDDVLELLVLVEDDVEVEEEESSVFAAGCFGSGFCVSAGFAAGLLSTTLVSAGFAAGFVAAGFAGSDDDVVDEEVLEESEDDDDESSAGGFFLTFCWFISRFRCCFTICCFCCCWFICFCSWFCCLFWWFRIR